MKIQALATAIMVTACLAFGCSGGADSTAEEDASQETVAAIERAPETIVASKLHLTRNDVVWEHDIYGQRKLIWYRKGQNEVFMVANQKSVPFYAITVRHNGSAERAPSRVFGASLEEYANGKPHGSPSVDDMKKRVSEMWSILHAFTSHTQSFDVQPSNACMATVGAVETIIGFVGAIGGGLGIVNLIADIPVSGTLAATAAAACAAAPLVCLGVVVVAGVVVIGTAVFAHNWAAQNCYVH